MNSQPLAIQPTLYKVGDNPLTVVNEMHQCQEIERQCGTYLIRKGLEAMTENDRDVLLSEMQSAGLLTAI